MTPPLLVLAGPPGGRVHAAFADLGVLEAHVVDSSALRPDETVAEVQRRLDAGSLRLR